MVVDPNLLVSTKEGLADGFTFGVIEGPKQLLIQAKAGHPAECDVMDIPPRNTVGIILTLDLVSQADWQVARLCFHETLVGIDVGVGFFLLPEPSVLGVSRTPFRHAGPAYTPSQKPPVRDC